MRHVTFKSGFCFIFDIVDISVYIWMYCIVLQYFCNNLNNCKTKINNNTVWLRNLWSCFVPNHDNSSLWVSADLNAPLWFCQRFKCLNQDRDLLKYNLATLVHIHFPFCWSGSSECVIVYAYCNEMRWWGLIWTIYDLLQHLLLHHYVLVISVKKTVSTEIFFVFFMFWFML